MSGTSFHSSGTSTALGGGEQESWSDPEKGLRIKTSSNGSTGEMFCKDGRSYISASLLTDSLKQSGQSTRDGRTSTTTYDSFGEQTSISMPTEAQTMPMEEFRDKVTGS